jgi:hypothetical protein
MDISFILKRTTPYQSIINILLPSYYFENVKGIFSFLILIFLHKITFYLLNYCLFLYVFVLYS